MTLLTLLLALMGLAGMGLSQTGHHQWALGRKPAPTLARQLRVWGLATCILALAPAMFARGPAMGAVGWLGTLSLAAFVLLLARTFLPSPTRR